MSQSTLAAPAQLAGEIADWLLSLLPPGRPRRLARMSFPGEMKPEIERDKAGKPIRDAKGKVIKTGRMVPRDKYEDIYAEQLTLAMLTQHARGAKTYSYTLDKNGKAREGAIDVDEGGQPALLALLRAGAELGVTLYAVENDAGAAHKGGHVRTTPFDDLYPAEHIKALMTTIAERAGVNTKEIWPGSNQGIRGPLGLHQLDQTRGNLLLQSGEIISLDLDLAAGFAAVRALPLNSAPPEPPRPAAPQARPAGAAQVISLAQPRRQQGGAAPIPREQYLAILKEARAYILATYDLATELQGMGADPAPGGYTCPCGADHGPGTKITIAPGGKAGYNHSDNGKCALPRKAGIDVTNVLMLKYGCTFDKLARQLAAHLFPEPKPRKARQEAPTPAPQPEQRSEAARAAYNAERRAQRHTEARQALDRLYEQVRGLELVQAVPAGVEPEGHSDRAHLLFAYLHQRATDAGALQVAPTNEQLAADLQFCRRYVIYAFRELEAAGIGKRTGGKGGLPGQPNEAATWTFFRAPNLVCKPQQNAECTLSYIELDLVPTLEACERAPQSPAPEPLAEWECWQPAEWECSPYDLDLEAPPAVEPEQPALVELPAGWRIVRPARGPWCWAAAEGAMTATHPRDTSDQVLIAAAWAKAAALAEVRAVEPAQPEPTPAPATVAHQEAPAGPGASYSPPPVEPSGEYTARVKDLLDFSEQWAAATSAIKVRSAHQEAPAAPGTIDLLDPRHAEQEDPLVRAAPVEPAAAARYWSLKGKLRKASSTKQIAWLRRQIADLEIWRPASELVAERASVGDARPSQARRAAGPPPRSPAQQALLFGGAL